MRSHFARVSFAPHFTVRNCKKRKKRTPLTPVPYSRPQAGRCYGFMLKAIPTVTRMQLSLIFLSSVDFREQSAEMSFTLPPLKQKFPLALLFTSDYVCRC